MAFRPNGYSQQVATIVKCVANWHVLLSIGLNRFNLKERLARVPGTRTTQLFACERQQQNTEVAWRLAAYNASQHANTQHNTPVALP